MKKKLLFTYLLGLFSVILLGQETLGPTVVSQGRFIKKTQPLRDFATVTTNPDRSLSELKIIPNNLIEGSDSRISEQNISYGPDPILQKEIGRSPSFAPQANFDGATVSEGGAVPPDPSGAVGPNHYVHAVNLVVKIFDKTGNLLAGPTSLGEFLTNGANNGDPIIMYDHLADRFFVSQFQTSNNALIIGVSDTPDPTGAYNLYEFPLDSFPDYPHYSVWPDAYYMTANKSGETTYAIEREVLIAGGASPEIIGFNLPGVVNSPNTVFSPEPANLLGTDFPVDTPGYIVYLQDDGWEGVSVDHLKVWEIEVDFVTPSNSTISQPLEIPTEPFDSVFQPFGSGDLEQPGTSQKIDMIGGVISYAANYRSFDDYNSWLITFNVDVDGNDTAGIRWTELRNNNTDDWNIFQQGTYAPEDGNSRFMGSGGIDQFGNIGLAFNIGSSVKPVGISYTGRFIGDPLGEMTVNETVIVAGGGVQSNTNRFGDYSQLTMDPDNLTFWHTAEYFSTNNFWTSRIASFQLTGEFDTDVAVTSIPSPVDGALTASESIIATVRNLGTSDISNFTLEMSLDGTLIASEQFTGTLIPNEFAEYTFTQTVDMSTVDQIYIVEVRAILAGDEASENDVFTENIRHVFPNDVGVSVILTPETDSGLGDDEIVNITIQNYGSNDQSNFDVQYSLDGNAPVVETFTGIIVAGEDVDFTFATTVDISNITSYTITSKTNLATDDDTSNDELSKIIMNTCMPQALEPDGNGCQNDGIKQFILNTIDVDNGADGCNTEPADGPQGYADRTDLSTTLLNLEGENEYVLQARHNYTGGAGIEALSVWIDFDDDGIFEESEQLIAGVFFQDDNVLEDFNLVIPVGAALGSHTLRAKAIDTDFVGDINNPCSDFSYGEVQDYTVIISDVLSVDEQLIGSSELVVTSLEENRFDVQLATEFDGQAFLGVYNMLGQQLSYKPVARGDGGFRIQLDMSSMASGIYVLRMGGIGITNFQTAKIVVQ